ncbi:ABC-three component system protein [uncultured Agrobacterium sp.]|uniref:ABC-three component system protein n=1 Tax=uncultured Agrobacterium sp. TaxID=157277 RepID=UPI0025F40ED4|nr:ABC-three component system protein [uncultured Agrobacterium sp.]
MQLANQYDASGSLAGYLYQCRLALLLAIREMKVKPNCHVSIEKFDDIAFHEEDLAHCVVQAKHHIGPKDVTDNSVDIWKTLRIWISQLKAGSFSNADTRRLLITTATAPAGGALAMLRNGSGPDDRNVARERLSAAARASTNKTSEPGRHEFLSLTDEEADVLLASIVVLDGAPDLHNVFDEVEGELRILSATSADKVAQSLEGWWLGVVAKRLVGVETSDIPVQHIAIKAQEFAALYGPAGLPVSDPTEFGERPYSIEDEGETYVKQMRLIQLSDRAIKRGIQDFYRSNTQRSKWARENLLLDGDVARFESKLQDSWERKFEEECGEAQTADDASKNAMGRKVFHWASQQQIEFRNVIETWITAGSFHGLADRVKVGWHPNFLDHLTVGADDGAA